MGHQINMRAGIVLAKGLATPSGGFAYHEVILENLANTLEDLALTTGNALNRLSASLKLPLSEWLSQCGYGQ